MLALVDFRDDDPVDHCAELIARANDKRGVRQDGAVNRAAAA
jgi:hypothetical protein